MLCFSVLPAALDPEYIFYDGHCGLCHRAVKFVLKHDRSGNTFRFAPLQGQTFQLRVPSKQIPYLPDSFVVLTREGKLLMRSDASLYVMRRLGGGWKVLADILGVIPRGLRALPGVWSARRLVPDRAAKFANAFRPVRLMLISC
jgi:predicted DCC family thiol-disulfide oxidoreductase YuxK